MAGQDAPYQHLKIFDDVVTTDFEPVRRGGQYRQGDDRRDAWPRRRPRSGQRVSHARSGRSRSRAGDTAAAGGVGLELTRQHYLRVIAAARQLPGGESRPPDRRLHPRHQRSADARDVGVGKACACCAARPGPRSRSPSFAATPRDPHVVSWRARPNPPSVVTGRVAAPGVGYIRIAGHLERHRRTGRRRTPPTRSRAARRN